ncbi:MAG: prepilin peptidase [Planctomycetes bacterium]|nr:prepilin peptidase [Planctomycetota bacterium]
MVTAVFEVGAALLGACVGSFLNVVIHRLPQEDPAKRSLGGRSRCPHCGVQIPWHDNLPVLGWILLRGRGRCCGKPIALRYPAVELLTAGLFLLLALLPPFGHPPIFAEPDGGYVFAFDAAAAFAFDAVFVALLVACTFIDLDHFILPDRLTKPGMAIGLCGGLWPGIAGVLGDDPGVALAVRTFLASLAGLLVGGGVTWAIRIAGSWVFRKEAMGFGDVKFMAMIGAFVGWQGALLTLFLGCVAGAVLGAASMLRGGAAKIPFGPYLAIGAVLALFWQRPILDFLFVTWPAWQRDSTSGPWILLAVALVSLVLLLVLVRRSRRLG